MTDEQASRIGVVERAIRIAGGTLVMCVAVLLAVIEAFLVPFTVVGAHVPLAAVLAIVGNLTLPVAMWWLTRRRPLALLPGAAWFAVTLVAAAPTASGDLIIPNTWPGLALLVAGAATITCVGYVVIAGRVGRTAGS